MEHKGSSYLYELPTGLCCESVESNQRPHTIFNFQFHFNTNLQSMPSSVMRFLPSGFAFNILYTFVISPMYVVCPVQLLLLPS
jgi:hypothetical protein